MRCCSSPAPTARLPTPQLSGRLLHRRGGSRSLPERRRHQRVRRRTQPVRGHQLRGAEQLLAVLVEPDDQRDDPGLRLLQRRVLGGVAGRPDASGSRQRARHPDGLLHGSVVCEWRLHRRFRVRRQHRGQRLPAAVARQEQHARRLDERRLEPGLLRRGRRARPVLPRSGDRAAARTRRSRPARSREKRHIRTWARTGTTTSSSPRRSRTPLARRGAAGQLPAPRSRSTSSSSPSRATTRRRSTTRSHAART